MFGEHNQNCLKPGTPFTSKRNALSLSACISAMSLHYICVLYITLFSQRRILLIRRIFLCKNSAIVFKSHCISSQVLHGLCFHAIFERTYIYTYTYTSINVHTYEHSYSHRTYVTQLLPMPLKQNQFYQDTKVQSGPG
jgi:hypothetical protein